jgi:hypothetical protein
MKRQPIKRTLTTKLIIGCRIPKYHSGGQITNIKRFLTARITQKLKSVYTVS